MRASDEGLYRNSGTREFDKRYFIAFEGFTEYAYFQGLKRNREHPEIRISRKIDIQCLSRFDQNAGDSNPVRIEEAMEEYRLLIKEGTYSVNLFVSTIIQEVFSHLCGSLKKSEKKNCRFALHNLQSELISKLCCSDFVSGYIVNDGEWDEAAQFCKEQIESGRFKGCGRYVKVPKNRKIETFDENNDIFCLVVDRDVQSNPAPKYRSLIEICKKRKIRLYVTNPCIEFWLILHYPGSLKFDDSECEKIRINAKTETEKGIHKTYCETKLLEFDPGYTKTSLDFDNKYLKRVKDALDHSDSFDTDLNKLENHIGSNLGELIRELSN